MNRVERIKSRGKILLAAYPYFVFLLPAFFVIHGMNENFGYVAPEDAWRLWLVYTGCAITCFGIFYIIYRRRVKAALVTIYLFSIYFFYGVMQDFLAAHAGAINRYTIWLPLLLVLFILLLVYMKRTRSNFPGTTLYLNLLLLVLIVVDVFGIVSKSVLPPRSHPGVNPPQFDATGVCRNCPKPDVYLLLFDEYMSSVGLKYNLGFDNSDIDSFLVSRQFRLQPASRGNYNFTSFSMSSILNMSYISGLNPEKITGNEYAMCIKLLHKNAVVKNFAALGYEVQNLSTFDMEGVPAPIHENILPSKTELITGQTLFTRLRKHLAWHFVTGRFAIPALTNEIMYLYYHNNNRVMHEVVKASETSKSQPRFVYGHFMMPHYPFLFDSTGKFRDLSGYKGFEHSNELYLDNLRYTNRKIKELVALIQHNTAGKAAIIVMGDHGYRSDSMIARSEYFKNYNAVYLPPGYQMPYYDSITGVNQFRALFNSFFNSKIPLLKDSTVFLVDQ